MSDDYGNDFITITDEDGNEFELEHIDTLESGDEMYVAFIPADMDEDDDDYGLVILKVEEEGGEEILASINDEEELNAVYEMFMQRFSDEQ